MTFIRGGLMTDIPIHTCEYTDSAAQNYSQQKIQENTSISLESKHKVTNSFVGVWLLLCIKALENHNTNAVTELMSHSWLESHSVSETPICQISLFYWSSCWYCFVLLCCIESVTQINREWLNDTPRTNRSGSLDLSNKGNALSLCLVEQKQAQVPYPSINPPIVDHRELFL